MNEKIIERLENLAKHAVHYVGEPPFVMSLDDGIALQDAINLLKAQEPRVLSKNEAEQYVTHGITDGYSETPPLYVEYQKPQRYYLKWVTLETAYSWMNDYGTSHVYGSELRFWTSRPSEQQMRDTPWEGEDNG